MARDTLRRAALAAAALLAVAGCAPHPETLSSEPTFGVVSSNEKELRALPPARQPIVVAVYEFRDQTGQNKPNEAFPEYSRAVTQGGASILVKALQDVSSHKFYTVVERQGLNSLLQERQIITTMRQQYAAPDGRQVPPLDPLLYAGIILDGGIIAYESNTLTGGLGARFLGVGGATEYRADTVTVYLRAISVRTGEVLKSVNASKTIYSSGLTGGAYKFVAVRSLLEVETGITVNEPPQFATRRAIEKAVYALTMEGVIGGLWSFGDADMQRQLIEQYVKERDET